MEQQDTKKISSRIAVLIDGDNAQPSLIREMLAEVSKFGRITIRRIYGDWTTSNMNGWKESLQSNAIQPVQQFRYTVGKNATDSAMIIDALDILYSKVVDGFCLVSSDSDYTRLAMRIREEGLFVMGIGRKLTPQAFRNACEMFVFAENLSPQTQVTQTPAPPASHQLKSAESTLASDPLPTLKKAVEISAQEDGWAFLGLLGNKIRSIDPSFDSRTYGFPGLQSLIASYPAQFELKEIKQELGSLVYVRLK
jgi:hypothetical protein